MNEKLKQLCEQAKEYANEHTKDFTGNEPVVWMDYYTEKFAELIVRQCIYLVENLPPGYKDYRNQIEDSFRTDCVEKIEQYFGVEE